MVLTKTKKIAVLLLTLALTVGALASCGSDSSSSDLSGSVSTNGSTSMESVVGGLSEQFMKDNPDVTVTYDATGSGTGIEAVANGTTDIGLASRDLKDEEKDKGLQSETVALDGIVVIVSEDSNIDDLTLEQVSAIYTGTTTNWADLGGASGTVVTVGREAGSGTRDGFESITGTEDKCKLNQELTSTGAVIEAVKSNPNAVGYVSFSATEGQEGIKVLKIDGVECTEDTISDGTYKIQRPFNLITKKDTDLSEEAQAFYDYMLSDDAKEQIEAAGAVPVSK